MGEERGGKCDCVDVESAARKARGLKFPALFDHKSLPQLCLCIVKAAWAINLRDAPVLPELRNPVLSSVDLRQEFVEPCCG